VSLRNSLNYCFYRIALSYRGGCNGPSEHVTSAIYNDNLVVSRVGKPPLVAAVSEAGALGTHLRGPISYVPLLTTEHSGILTALTQPNPEALRVAIRETRKLTSKPFGVNITLLPSINPPDYEGFARVAVEEGIKIIETAGNNRKSSCILCQ
jgi:NAD(P)H-dependent flavin oxidoreductase YrpB (nitropropane dioxygenase family)